MLIFIGSRCCRSPPQYPGARRELIRHLAICGMLIGFTVLIRMSNAEERVLGAGTDPVELVMKLPVQMLTGALTTIKQMSYGPVRRIGGWDIDSDLLLVIAIPLFYLCCDPPRMVSRRSACTLHAAGAARVFRTRSWTVARPTAGRLSGPAAGSVSAVVHPLGVVYLWTPDIGSSGGQRRRFAAVCRSRPCAAERGPEAIVEPIGLRISGTFILRFCSAIATRYRSISSQLADPTLVLEQCRRPDPRPHRRHADPGRRHWHADDALHQQLLMVRPADDDAAVPDSGNLEGCPAGAAAVPGNAAGNPQRHSRHFLSATARMVFVDVRKRDPADAAGPRFASGRR